VLAVARVPERALDDLAPTAGATLRLLILDAVQDPGNVGTIVRTAAALGFDGTVATPGTVDLWNAKVVRSAMGAHFSHPAVSATWEAVDTFCSAHDVVIWGADAGGRPLDASSPHRLALVLGNEGAGLGPDAHACVDQLVSIPIAQVESLNVAVAAGILMYALRPHDR
jgi:TrmH family RNA methyltransferase